MKNLMCTMRCVWCLFLYCLYIILPAVGLVWWFIAKTPVNFMYTCIGMSLIWVGLGAGYYLYRHGRAKICSCNPKS
jgi:hypothetical protein